MNAVDHAYNYLYPSEVLRSVQGVRLRLATSSARLEHPLFFKGRLVQPGATARLLLALSELSLTRYYVTPSMIARAIAAADPVVTSGGERLRFEAFSLCGGVYARLDLHPEAIEGDWLGRGTTNVDFNPAMRAALGRIRAVERVSLAVGADRVELERESQQVVERKVRLPARWVKSFVEVQSYQARLQPALQVSGEEAWRFLRALPRAVSAGPPAFVVPSGRGLRLSQREAPHAVAVGAPARLRLLEPFARAGGLLRVYGGASGVSGWELVLPGTRFHLVLSPAAERGFSGEGQVLEHLARDDRDAVLGRVRAGLRWQARLKPEELAAEQGLEPAAMARALSLLGSRGLVGFDLGEGAYFHRELPFDIERVETTQPRLRDARRLIAEGGVRMVRSGAEVEAYVRGTDVEHRVRSTPAGLRCTCRWFSSHQGERGPCKHILAVRLATGADGPQ